MRGEATARGAANIHALACAATDGPFGQNRGSSTLRTLIMAQDGYLRHPTIRDGVIAFVCDDDVWRVEAEGGVARRLTTGLGEPSTPVLSPDGKWIAFVGRDEQHPEVYLMSSEGGPARRMTWLGPDVMVRGFTPEGFQLFAERIGVSKSDSWIDMSVLEDAMRDDLNARAQRRVAVLDPVKLVIDNYPADTVETMHPPNHPQHPEWGRRPLAFGRELWIERDDFAETPPKGFFRLTPGAEVRLRYAYIVRCTGVEKDADGRVSVVHCTYDPATRSGTAGADARKVKGNIHWLAVGDAVQAEVRLYDRLFRVPFPGARNTRNVKDETAGAADPLPLHAHLLAGDDDEVAEAAERSYLDDLNPASKRVITAYVEPALATAPAEERVQFERHGYFVADLIEHAPGRPVFNRAVTLKDSWK